MNFHKFFYPNFTREFEVENFSDKIRINIQHTSYHLFPTHWLRPVISHKPLFWSASFETNRCFWQLPFAIVCSILVKSCSIFRQRVSRYLAPTPTIRLVPGEIFENKITQDKLCKSFKFILIQNLNSLPQLSPPLTVKCAGRNKLLSLCLSVNRTIQSQRNNLNLSFLWFLLLSYSL